MITIHPTADVQAKSIGDGTTIWQFSIVLPGAQIGGDCNINCHVFIENDVIVGNNVTIKPGVQLWNGLRIEDGVFIGPNVSFVNDQHPRSQQRPEKFLITTIKKGASIGANATVLGSVTVGRYAFVGAGSVVTKDVPGNVLMYGNPASRRGFVCNCGSTLTSDLICKKCGLRYYLNQEKIGCYDPVS
jgi:acetyltransferase-like isoleucine patch superfamily enzyme